MSQLLSTQQSSLEAPSRYTVFERDVFGCSSPVPVSQKRPKPCSKSQDKAKKLKRFSEVAFAGESPNLQDVSSGLSKSKPSVLVVSPDQRSIQIVEPSSSRQKNGVSSPVLFDSRSGSTTPSLRLESRNASGKVPSKKVSSRLASPPQATQDPTGDLLTTESFIESSALINGQPNVLRIESSPDAALPNTTKLSRNQQVELSVRKAQEWLNSLPEDSEPVPYVAEQDNSLVSTVSRRSDGAADRTHGSDSVLLVAPDPTVREVRILLQRLDPQVLLRVPIRDIQNLISTPSHLSLANVQKTMNNLLSSNKMGVTTVDQEVMKSIQGDTVTSKAGNTSNSKSKSMEKKVVGKRKLFTVQRQTSNISQELSDSTENANVQCPYTPPTKKRGRPAKKPRRPFQKKLIPDLGKPRTKSKKKRSPKQKKPSEEESPPTTEQAVVTRTRSSEALKAQTTPQPVRCKPNPEKNQLPTNAQRKSHEMTLRKKSNPRRTSLFFQPKSQVPKPKKPVKRNSASTKTGPRIVCTFLHREQVDRVAAVIKKLGGIMENKVTALTTHVVCGGPKRTINLLRGIARGCWLVTYEWVLQSMGKRKWVEEEPYEVTNFSPAVQKCRIARETLGLYPTIFEKVGTIYVAPKTKPPKSELCELLKLCGAKVVTTTRRATVAVGTKIPEIQSVNEVWVLDSIQENVLLPLQRYLL